MYTITLHCQLDIQWIAWSDDCMSSAAFCRLADLCH